MLGIATPSFWLGIMLIYVFCIQLGWLPSARMGGPAHYILPAITLGAFLVAGMMRLVRSSVLEILDTEFVKLARIKGLPQTVVIWKHCLRNALIPVVTLFGVFFALLVTGAIVTETVFAWPGVGRLTYEAVIFRDYPLLQAVILMKADHRARRQPRRGHPLRLPRPARAVLREALMARLEGTADSVTARGERRRRRGRASPERLRGACRGSPSSSSPCCVLVAVFAPVIAPHSPTEQSLPDKLKPPAWQEGGSATHLLGTDLLGRDLLQPPRLRRPREPHRRRVALLSGGGIGLAIGIVSGYARRPRRQLPDARGRRHPHVPDDPDRAAPRGEPRGRGSAPSSSRSPSSSGRGSPGSSAARCSA